MLRGLMIDPKTGSDERFFRLLRDFVSRYQGQSVSTEDFIQHAAKYVTPESDLERNHKLNWFFNEWVYKTGVPTYHLETDIRELAANKYLVQGSIAQNDVPRDFEMLVPVVAIYAKGRRITLGRVAVSENGARFKFTTARKPSRVAIDDENLLAVVH
jgi:aminopeptidase N